MYGVSLPVTALVDQMFASLVTEVEAISTTLLC